MAGSRVGSALESLQAELREVEEQLAGYESLRDRRERLINAIEATLAIEAMARPVVSASEEFRTTVQRVLARNLPAGEPGTPSEAALAVLREAKTPLHIRDLIAMMHGKGWFADRTYEQLRATVAGTLDARASKRTGGIMKPEPATYVWIGVPDDSTAEHVGDNGQLPEGFADMWRSALGPKKKS